MLGESPRAALALRRAHADSPVFLELCEYLSIVLLYVTRINAVYFINVVKIYFPPGQRIEQTVLKLFDRLG
jgi:hypothetical protein